MAASRTWRSHHECILGSPVSSGWKLVPKTFPCRTAMISPASLSASILFPSPASLAARPGRLANTSTWLSIAACAAWSFACLEGATMVSSRFCSPIWTPPCPGRILSTTGARMKTAGKELCSTDSKNCKSNDAWKLSTCRPKWFRFTRTSRPPISSWPPFLVRLADSASRMRPAQVPQVGLRWTL